MEGCEAPFEVTDVMERPVRTGGGGDSTPSTKHGVLSEQEPRESDTDEEGQERSVDEARGKAALNFRGWKQVVKEGKTTWTAEWGGDWDSVALWWGWSDDDQEHQQNTGSEKAPVLGSKRVLVIWKHVLTPKSMFWEAFAK